MQTPNAKPFKTLGSPHDKLAIFSQICEVSEKLVLHS
jgi:hypothetical protein